ncbi:MAG: efflux RND transporter periplasmic adaptor subunit [Nitratireductor sp.]|nr:efflux RND transporter periplasmic adaptor subunit [Nitratireductor sp.]
MAFRVRSSHIIALLITAGIAGWMTTGTLYVGGEAKAGEEAPAVIDREATRTSELFKVRYVPLLAKDRIEAVQVRGRTAADATVSIKAETAGVLEKRLVNKGDQVKAGDLVCKLEPGVREARIAQAEAQLNQAQAEYESNLKLMDKGFSAENKLNAMKAALDAAKAVLAEAKWELGRTEIHANAAGIVIDPIAEPGGMLKVGDVCVTIMDTDPMLFIGQISERDIGQVATGMGADVKLVTGETIKGTIRYIAPAADAATRTFRTEIALEDPQHQVRDGLTASAVIWLPSMQAFRISPSWITLADNGEIGIRVVNGNDTVRFVPIQILAQSKKGFWISGPEAGMRIITLGQEYVIDGEKVDPVLDPAIQARLQQATEGADQ